MTTIPTIVLIHRLDASRRLRKTKHHIACSATSTRQRNEPLRFLKCTRARAIRPAPLHMGNKIGMGWDQSSFYASADAVSGGRSAISAALDDRGQQQNAGGHSKRGKLSPEPHPCKAHDNTVYSARARPSARHLSSASSSGASQQITLSQARGIPAARQSFSHSRIHSPSPQP